MTPDSPLLLNGIRQRLAKLQVTKESIGYLHYRLKNNDLMPAEARSEMDRLLTGMDKYLQTAEPYQFLPGTVEHLIAGNKNKISGSIRLPFPVTWIDIGAEESSAYKGSGTLLIDDGRGRILANLFLMEDRSPDSFHFKADKVFSFLLSALNPSGQVASARKKNAPLGQHKTPVIIVPNMVFDGSKGGQIPHNGAIPLYSERGDGLPLLISLREIIETYDKTQIAALEFSYVKEAERALRLAHAIATRDPRINIHPPAASSAEDDKAVDPAKNFERKASIVVLNPNLAAKAAVAKRSNADAIALSDKTYLSLADFVIESGRHAEDLPRRALRHIGRELVLNSKHRGPITKRFLLDEKAISIWEKLNQMPVTELIGEFHRIVMPWDKMWIEEVVDPEIQDEQTGLRRGILFKQGPNEITARYATECLISDTPKTQQGLGHEEARKLGFYARDNRYLMADDLEIIMNNNGPGIDYTNSVQPQVQGKIPKQNSDDIRAADAQTAQNIFRLLFITCGSPLVNLTALASEDVPPGSLQTIRIDFPEELEQALLEKNWAKVKETLGWTAITPLAPPKLPDQSTPSLASFVIESGKHAKKEAKEVVRAIGRELMIDEENPENNAKRFVLDSRTKEIWKHLDDIPLDVFVAQFNRVVMPCDKLWIEEPIDPVGDSGPNPVVRSGLLFKRCPGNEVRVKFAIEFLAIDAPQKTAREAYAEAQEIGTYIRDDHYITPNDIEVVINEKGASVDYRNSVHAKMENAYPSKIGGTKTSNQRAAEHIYRLFLLICGSPLSNLVAQTSEPAPSGTLQPLHVGFPDGFEQALHAKDWTQINNMLGWTSAPAIPPVPPALADKMTSSLADFVIEAGKYAKRHQREPVRAIGRELMVKNEYPLDNARRFIIDHRVENIWARLSAIPIQEFTDLFDPSIVPFDRFWIEKTADLQNENRGGRIPLRTGYLFRNSPDGIRVRHVTEFMLADSPGKPSSSAREEAERRGAYIRNDHFVVANDIVLVINEKGVGVDYTGSEAAHLQNDLPKEEVERRRSDDLKFAEDVFRLFVMACHSPTINQAVASNEAMPKGGYPTIPIDIPEALEQALLAKDWVRVRKILGWPDKSQLPLPSQPLPASEVIETRDWQQMTELSVAPGLLLNTIFERMADIRRFRKMNSTPYAVHLTGGELTGVDKFKMDRLMTGTEDELHKAVTYQILPKAMSTILNNGNVKLAPDFTLPAPITWIEVCSTDQNMASGALLIDNKDGSIAITFFGKADSASDNLHGYKNPMLMVPHIIFDRELQAIHVPAQGSLCPLFTDADGTKPRIYEYSSRLAEDTLGDGQALISGLAKVSQTMLLFAQAISRGNPRVYIGPSSAPDASNDEGDIEAGEAYVRQAAVVRYNSEFDAANASQQQNAALPSSTVELERQAWARQNWAQIEELAVAPEPYLNGIFQRLAKIRIARKVREYPYARKLGGKLGPAEKFQMNALLTETERTLRKAVAYQFLTKATAAMLADEDFDMTRDFALPSPITWVEVCPSESGLISGALFVEGENGEISLSLFTDMNELGLEAAQRSEALIFVERNKNAKKFAALGQHEKPTLLVPNITFNREERTISIPDKESLWLLFVEIRGGAPVVYDYNSKVRDDESARALLSEIERVAKTVFLLVHAITKKHPRIMVGPVPLPALTDDRGVIEADKAFRRQAAVVAFNPGYTPATAIEADAGVVAVEEQQPSGTEAEVGVVEGLAGAPVEPVALPQDVVAGAVPPDTADLSSETAGENGHAEEIEQVAAVFSSVVAAENGAPTADIHAPPQEVNVTLLLVALSPEEQLEKEMKWLEAIEDARVRLLADAAMYLMQAQNKGLTHFECRILLNKPGFPIQLHFAAAMELEGERKAKKATFILNYAQAYAERDIPLTMNDAVDLKIIVQSMVCNAEGIVPIHDPSGGGQRAVELDTQMPLPVLDYKVMQRSGGVYTMIFKAVDPYTKEVIRPSIPLGFAARHEDEAAEKKEADERVRYVLDYLMQICAKRTTDGHRIFVTKRDVLMKLRSRLQEQNKEWLETESTELPGFEAPTILYVSELGTQKVTLGTVMLRMDPGGDNPSWRCILVFYIGDKNKRDMGLPVRRCHLHLHTRNLFVAMARSIETLKGVRDLTGGQILEGLLPVMQQYTLSAGQEWRVENKGEPSQEAYIGDRSLQFFFDNMMRYAHDIGVKIDGQEVGEDGNITITLQALRALTGDRALRALKGDKALRASVGEQALRALMEDRGKKAQFAPEYVYESVNDKRGPIAFKVKIPAGHVGKIDDFVKLVHRDVGWHAAEAYASVAIGTGGREDQPKKPLEFRTAQVRLSIIRTIEESYEKIFDFRLPRKWHKPGVRIAFSTEPPERTGKYREQRSSIFIGVDHRMRYHRPNTFRFILG